MRRFCFIVCMICGIAMYGVTLDMVEFHNEATDTAKITDILVKNVNIENNGERIGNIGRGFIGTPYVAHTLEGEKELLRINLDAPLL